MKYLPENFKVKDVKNILQKEWTELKIDTVTLLDNGWDNAAFDVNGEYIFRFPKDSGTHFDMELKLLNTLRGKITMPIPSVEFLGKEIKYMGYKKLQGGDLTMEIYNSMTSEQRDKLATDYAKFAFEIHNALPVDQARTMGVHEVDPMIYIPIISSSLTPEKIPNGEILAFAKNTVKEYVATINDNVIPSFIYGDLHTENIAFDPVTKQLNGIFDFGDACIGDIHFEFAPIYKFSTELLESTVRKYEVLANIKLSLRKIVLSGRMNELGDLAQFIDKPESEIYTKAMTRMSKWIDEKDIYKKSL
jgi:hypothetical protein